MTVAACSRNCLAAALIAATIACLALAAAPAANAATCPASIAPVPGGYGHADTGGRDDGTPGTEPLWAAGQLIVSLKRAATTAELRCVARELKAEILDGDRSADGLAGMRNTMVIQLNPGVSVAKTMRLLEQRRYEKLVRYAAPNYEISYEANPTREPLYPVQWGLGNGKVVPKKTPSAERLAEMNDPNTAPERKASLEARYMSALKFQAPFGEADRLLSPGTFVQGMTPFSIQAQRAWKKMPSAGFFDLGPSSVNVAVIDSGLANHYELDDVVGDRNRSFALDGRAYRVTVKPGANGSYRLKGTKTGYGSFETCPINVNATAAQVEGWLNRRPEVCAAPEATTVALAFDADGGTFAVRTASGRIATGIPWNVEPAKLGEYMRLRLGLAAGEVDVSSQGVRGTRRTLTVSFPTPVYDREQLVFDGGQLKLGAGAGTLGVGILRLDQFTVSAKPANAPAAETWSYQVDARDGNEFSIDRAPAYAAMIDEPSETGGVQRSKPAGKWTADPIGHGTFVAGIIAANPGNGQGMTGVLNNSSVNLTGLVPQGGSVTVAAAITHAADTNQADVVNISMNWGSNRIFSTDPALPRPKKLADADPIAPDVAVDAIANVRNTKTLFVVAAGNESVNVFDDAPETDKVVARNDELRRQGRLNEVATPRFAPYPCRPKNGGRKSVLQMPDGTSDRGNIICVASANWYGEPSEFTDWGAGVVDVAAPGENMVGPDASDGLSFRSGDGTSYSAPVVAGIAAMINQKFTGISEASIVKCAILSSATTRPLVIAGGGDFGSPWKAPLKAYGDRNLLGEKPGELPLSKQIFTVKGMVQADEALSAAGSLWSRYQAAVRKNTAKPKCVQRRAGSFWGKGKWINAADLPPGF